MKERRQKLHRALYLLTAVLLLPGCADRSVALAAEINGDEGGIAPLFAGAGALLDPRTTTVDLPGAVFGDAEQRDISGNSAGENTAAASVPAEASENSAAPEETSTLVMADVNEVMNVRALPDASSEKLGVLYKDCGGTILERGDGWTKLKSGNLIGWANNDYLLFGAAAEALAADVGMTIARVTTDSLRVRKEPNTDGSVYGLVKTGDELEVLRADDGTGFVMVDYEGRDGYISADYADISFRIDNGETLEEIRTREEEERKAKLKAKLTANQGAIQTSEDEARLLASLIQCEAGNQPYEGQLAVGAVVMNRVRSAAYPNTIVSVIYASGQFSPAGSGRVADVYNGSIKDSCLQAARAAINGETTVGGALHFRRAGMHDGTVIGGHVFW